jgi:hypothetical protein
VFSLFGVFLLFLALVLSPARDKSIDQELQSVCNQVNIVTQGPRRLDVLFDHRSKEQKDKDEEGHDHQRLDGICMIVR